MYFPKGTMDVEKPGRFSRTEIIHLLISMFVLTIAFSFALSGNFLISGSVNFNEMPFFILLSFLGIITAFVFHELSHKIIAQKYGLWSEYRMFPMGLILALFLGVVTGFVFAAPGAVMFMGGSKGYETGKIAAAGPTANIIIALIALPLYLFIFFEDQLIGGIIGFICLINAFLATFNLLPIGPLDGGKIIRWNINAWIILFIIAVAMTVVILPRFSLVF